MQRLLKFDVPERLASVMPAWAAQIATALVVLAVAGLMRMAVDALVPGLAPFALLYPACLVATMLAGWRAGAVTLIACELAAWYYFATPRGLPIRSPAPAAELALIAVTGVIVIALTELFRAAARRVAQEGAAKLAERDLMLSELDHRMANNFAMVASLLEMQRSRAADAPSREALGSALNRVVSISRAHRNLYSGGAEGPVDMGVYLPELCRHLADALFLGEIVRLECEAAPAAVERDRAVAIGLIVNELVTNAAKHAFSEGGAGSIRVAFAPSASGYSLTVADDGKGLPADFGQRRKGLGRGLVEAFTRQARGVMRVETGPGARFVVDLTA